MKPLRFVASSTLVVLVAVLTAGCGGFSGSKSVSPASFFLPGLMDHTTPQPKPGEPTPPTPAAAEAGLRES